GDDMTIPSVRCSSVMGGAVGLRPSSMTYARAAVKELARPQDVPHPLNEASRYGAVHCCRLPLGCDSQRRFLPVKSRGVRSPIRARGRTHGDGVRPGARRRLRKMICGPACDAEFSQPAEAASKVTRAEPS